MIKRWITYLLVMLLVVQTTSSAWILVSFYANRNYIAENICINRFDAVPVCRGMCYLNTQLEKDRKEDQKFPSTRDKEIQLQLYILHTTDYSFSVVQQQDYIAPLPAYKDENHTDPLLYADFQPPEMA